MILGWILGFSLLISLGSLALAAGFLLLGEGWRRRLVPALVAYATGALLGAAFLKLIPHALEHLPTTSTLAAVAAGILVFFMVERTLLWRHCHDEGCQVHGGSAVLLLLGDGLHNFVDGAALAAAFLLAVPVGVATSLAILAHEIPQEIGDFAILLSVGYSRRRAILFNGLSGLATLVAALLTYAAAARIAPLAPYLAAVAAASFLYIAVADLIPYLHRRSRAGRTVAQLLLMAAGLATIAVLPGS